MGPELCQQMTFVGGCSTGLLLTDDFAKEQVRHTDDVDLIVHTLGGDDTLGFTNRWYQDAMQTATDYALTPAISIRLVAPVYFLATKLEAYNGRWYV